MNTLVITSHGLAMLFEHGKLLLYAGRIITHIAGISVLRHQLERHLLTVTPDQQRDMGLLDALGLVNGTTHLVILTFKGGLFLCPHSANHLNRFAQLTQTFRRIRIRIAIAAVLVLIPTRPDTNV